MREPVYRSWEASHLSVLSYRIYPDFLWAVITAGWFPVSALMGGVVLVLSDIAARMINAPFDTPVGALVSILGVPVFFALTFRKEGMVL